MITNFKIFENWYSQTYDKLYTKPDYSKFLIDLDYTFDWYLEHNPDLETSFKDSYYEEENAEEVYIKFIKKQISDYSEIYKKVKKENKIKIQRQIFVDDVDNIDYNNIGQYWSFNNIEINLDVENKNIRITVFGVANFDDILWENSFDNYIYYGAEESEIKLKKGKKIHLYKMEIFPKIITNKIFTYHNLDGTSYQKPSKEWDFKNKKIIKIDKIATI